MHKPPSPPPESSWNIPVRLFRMVMFVPFAIEDANPADPRLAAGADLADAISQKICCSGSKWREQPTLSNHLHTVVDREDLRAGAYEEFVYFHPYVQRFLYGASGERAGNVPSEGASGARPQPISLFYRDDIAFLDLTLAGPVGLGRRLRLTVDRVNAYLFDTGHLILATELAFDFAKAAAAGAVPRLSLAEAMAIASLSRRVFPPFLPRASEQKAGRIAAVPADFTWVDAAGNPLACGDEDYVKHVEDTLAPPLRPAWRALLAPLPIEGYDDADVRLSQCGDDRAPYMLLVGVDDPAAIATEDWYRLCFGDKPGKLSTAE